MLRAHHDSFLLSPYSLKAVLHLRTARYHWTVPECLLWVTKLTLPICWTSIPSRAVPTQFPSRDLPSTSPPPSASRQPAPGPVLLPASLGPLSHSHCLTSASRTCSPFLRWQKGGRCTPLLRIAVSVCARETETPLPIIFAIVLLGSPTSVSNENICHGKTVIFQTLTFTSGSDSSTSDKN